MQKNKIKKISLNCTELKIIFTILIVVLLLTLFRLFTLESGHPNLKATNSVVLEIENNLQKKNLAFKDLNIEIKRNQSTDPELLSLKNTIKSNIRLSHNENLKLTIFLFKEEDLKFILLSIEDIKSGNKIWEKDIVVP